MEQDAAGAWHGTVLGADSGPCWMASAHLFGLAAEELTEGLRSALLADGAQIKLVSSDWGRAARAVCVSFFDPEALEGSPQALGLALPWREGEWTTYETAQLLTIRVSKYQFATFSQATIRASGEALFQTMARAHQQAPVRVLAVGPLTESSEVLARSLNAGFNHQAGSPLSGWVGLTWQAQARWHATRLKGLLRMDWRHPWIIPLAVLVLAWLAGLSAPQGSSDTLGATARGPLMQRGALHEQTGVEAIARSAQSLMTQVERVAQVVERVQGPRLEWLVLERLSPAELQLEIRVGPPRLGVATSGSPKETAGERLQTALSGLLGVTDVRVSNRTGDEVLMVLRLLEPLPLGKSSWESATELARLHAVALTASGEEAWMLEAPAQPVDRLLTFLPRLLSHGLDWGRLVVVREGDGLASLRLEDAVFASEGQR